MLTNILINTITNCNIDFNESEYLSKIINKFLECITMPDYEEGFAVAGIDKIAKKRLLSDVCMILKMNIWYML